MQGKRESQCTEAHWCRCCPSGWHTDASQRTRPGMRQVGALNQLPFSSLEANAGGCPGSLPSCDFPSSAWSHYACSRAASPQAEYEKVAGTLQGKALLLGTVVTGIGGWPRWWIQVLIFYWAESSNPRPLPLECLLCCLHRIRVLCVAQESLSVLAHSRYFIFAPLNFLGLLRLTRGYLTWRLLYRLRVCRS